MGDIKVRADDLKLEIDFNTYQKMRLYTKLCKSEIFGFLLVKENKNKDSNNSNGSRLLVYDIIIPGQEVSGSSCKPSGSDIAKALQDLPPEKQTDIKGWFHSHFDMGTFYSGTDTDTIENWGEWLPYVVSVVTNRKDEVEARIDLFKPVRIKIEDVPVILVYAEDEDLRKSIEDDLKAKIKSEAQEETRAPYPGFYSRKHWMFDCPFTGNTKACAAKNYMKCKYHWPSCPYKKTTKQQGIKHSEDSCPFWEGSTGTCLYDYREFTSPGLECPFFKTCETRSIY